MEEFFKGSSDAIAIFIYLLPGLVGLATYDYLVEGPKREIFDRVVFALSLTLISTLCVNHFTPTLLGRQNVHAVIAPMTKQKAPAPIAVAPATSQTIPATTKNDEQNQPTSVGVVSTIASMVGPEMGYITATCIVLAIFLAALTNLAIPLWVARKFRLTYKTSTVDVWQDVFYRFRGYWVRVTFSDGRELVGWPQYFSAVGQPRELFVASATWWITDENGQISSVDVVGAGVYIPDFSIVTAIALLT